MLTRLLILVFLLALSPLARGQQPAADSAGTASSGQQLAEQGRQFFESFMRQLQESVRKGQPFEQAPFRSRLQPDSESFRNDLDEESRKGRYNPENSLLAFQPYYAILLRELYMQKEPYAYEYRVVEARPAEGLPMIEVAYLRYLVPIDKKSQQRRPQELGTLMRRAFISYEQREGGLRFLLSGMETYSGKELLSTVSELKRREQEAQQDLQQLEAQVRVLRRQAESSADGAQSLQAADAALALKQRELEGLQRRLQEYEALLQTARQERKQAEGDRNRFYQERVKLENQVDKLKDRRLQLDAQVRQLRWSTAWLMLKVGVEVGSSLGNVFATERDSLPIAGANYAQSFSAELGLRVGQPKPTARKDVYRKDMVGIRLRLGQVSAPYLRTLLKPYTPLATFMAERPAQPLLQRELMLSFSAQEWLNLHAGVGWISLPQGSPEGEKLRYYPVALHISPRFFQLVEVSASLGGMFGNPLLKAQAFQWSGGLSMVLRL